MEVIDPDEPAFLEILEAAEVLDELPDDARRDAWASSVLGVWAEDPEAAQIDADFRRWLADVADPRADAVAEAVAGLVDVADGAVVATRAWCVEERGARSIGLGFRGADDSEHSLLGDVDEQGLASLIVAPGPEELFGGAEDMVDAQPMSVADAATELVEAWERSVRGGGPIPESVFVNGALARARLQYLVERPVDGLARPRPASPDPDPIDPGERAELDAWGISVLDGAGLGPGTEPPASLVDPLVPTRIAAYPASEAEAFLALEWADWLGVALGLSRQQAGVVVDPTLLVDLINRCPEVTSTIPKADRSYFEWAWSMVLPLWRAGGVIDGDNQLTADGADLLIGAMRSAWSG